MISKISKATVTRLRGDEIPIDEAMRAQAFWLVRKYTSHAYIERMVRLYSSFVHGYEEYAKTDPPEAATAFLRSSLATLYGYQGKFEAGLELLGRGFRRGYAEIGAGLAVDDFFHPRLREEALWEVIGQRYGPDEIASVGLYGWLEHALCMLARIKLTLGVRWSFPRIIQGPPSPRSIPANPAVLPKLTGIRVASEEEVPISGIWMPLDIPNSCPNYIWAGGHAPPGQRLAKRIYWPPHQKDKDTIAPEMTVYEYEPTPTRWELVWEDRRYKDGVLPDESEYLDGDDLAAFPPFPPRHQPG